MYIEEVLYHIDEDYRKWCDTVDLVFEELLIEDTKKKDAWFFDMSPEKQQHISRHIQIQRKQNNSKRHSKRNHNQTNQNQKTKRQMTMQMVLPMVQSRVKNNQRLNYQIQSKT